MSNDFWKPNTNLLVWEEQYRNTPEETARHNCDKLNALHGISCDYEVDPDYPEQVHGLVKFELSATNLSIFKKAIGRIISFRGDVLKEVICFVIKGQDMPLDWDSVEGIL